MDYPDLDWSAGIMECWSGGEGHGIRNWKLEIGNLN